MKKEKRCEYCGSLFIATSTQKLCSLKCRLLDNFEIKNGCWEWKKYLFPTGYGVINHENKQLRAHRASWMVFRGEIPEGKFVCHTCDNPKCINPDHLWLGTAKENAQDCKSKGRLTSWLGRKHREETKLKIKINGFRPDNVGEKHPLAKLKEKDVLEIRELIKSEMNQTEIARKYGVFHTVISNIKYKRTWAHI